MQTTCLSQIRSLFILPLCLILLAGCASRRSNYQKYDENFTILQIPVQLAEPKVTHTNLSANAIPATAIDLAAQFAKTLIDKEAERYEASSESTLRLPSVSPDTKPFLLVITRSFINSRETNLPCVTNQMNSLGNEITRRLKAVGFQIAPQYSTHTFLTNWVAQQGGSNRLSFCSLILADSAASGTMNLTLLGYTYPGLKAKNSAIHVPTFSWHKTKSVLSLALEGAAGNGTLAYKSDCNFSSKLVEWPRKAKKPESQQWAPTQTISGSVFGDAGTSQRVRYSSKFMSIPQGPIQINVTLTESSDMKKTLNKLAEKVGGLKLEDFKD